jgi:diguanylate cyclase (GGDEF)-like protein
MVQSGFVSLTASLVATMSLCAMLSALCGATVLAAVYRIRPATPGLLLAAGTLVGPAGVIAAVVIGSMIGRGAGEGRPLAATAVVGAACAISLTLLIAGLLNMPGVAPGVGARARRVLDGTILAASVFYVSWTLLIEPMHRRYLGRAVPMLLEARCLVVAVPSIVALIGSGIAVVISIRSAPPRGGVLLAGGSAVVTAAGGVALTFATFYRDDRWLAGSAGGYLLGLLGVAVAVRYSNRLLTAPPQRLFDRPTMSVLPLLAVVVATLIRPTYGGVIDQISVGAGAFIGLVVAAQQWLVRHDLRRDAAALAHSEAHFREMAYTDALTGLGNRRQLLAALGSELRSGRPAVLLAIDLDGFKNVNDVRGHDVGDAVLVDVAARLRANLRPGDLAARLGGDEFAALMWMTGAEATEVCERLLRVLSRPYETSGGPVFLSASIGVTTCAPAGATPDVPTLLHNADLALRYAKQQGKNRVQQYDEAYERWVRRRNAVADALRGSCDRGELRLAYQPVVALPEGRVAGVEALLRWRHPELGQVAPDEFIPIAEESATIDELGAFALHEACRQLARWLCDGFDIWLSVNVSVRELHCELYVDRVLAVLRAHQVPARRLVLEVTEHAVAVDVAGVVDRLDALRVAGVRVALDDFGSGYSSLGQLRTLPVDILKIDRALIAPPDALSARSSEPLVDVVVRLGRRLGLDVVAEGITDVGQRRILEEAGCPYGQGRLFGAAMSAESVEGLFGARVSVPVQYPGSVDSGREMRQS